MEARVEAGFLMERPILASQPTTFRCGISPSARQPVSPSARRTRGRHTLQILSDVFHVLPREIVGDHLEYYWSMHAKPIASKEKLRKFLCNYEGIFDQQDWTITNGMEQGDLMLCEGIEMLYDRVNQKVIRNPFMQAVEIGGGKVARMRDYYDGSMVAAPERKPAAG